jgi:AAA+ superfamily predicted ATPase
MHTNGVFNQVTEFPDPDAARRLKALVGLDAVKDRVTKEARIILDPESLDKWERTHHRASLRLTQLYRQRPPLFIFAGDVGTGKTALAESFGDMVARQTNITVSMFSLSLNARGTGAVGQMTGLITSAFAEVQSHAKKASRSGKRATAGFVFLVDEADAMAQSRAAAQMHHEDRAGVNALIRGIDDLADGQLPAVVVLCTNRLDALDPAVRRRAAATFQFERPNDEQRRAVLTNGLQGIRLSEHILNELVKSTGPNNGHPYGFTYSDLTQRLLPSVLMDAFPDKPVTDELVRRVAACISPTPPFGDDE